MTQSVSYFLPKSTTSVSINKRKALTAYDEILGFLNSSTKYRFAKSLKFGLVIPVKPEESEMIDLKKLENHFGLGKKEGGICRYPSGIMTHDFYSWEFAIEKLLEIIDFSEKEIKACKRFDYRITFTVDFVLLNKECEAFPNQNFEETFKHSDCLIFLNQNSCLIPQIIFPFEEYSEECKEFIEWIVPKLPFKFNEKHLRICKKNQEGYLKFKKIKGL